MSVKIRLMRFGKKGYPTYRMVAIDARKKRDGSYLEKVGFYNPNPTPAIIDVNEERIAYWTGVGAQMSEKVAALMTFKTNGRNVVTTTKKPSKKTLKRAKDAEKAKAKEAEAAAKAKEEAKAAEKAEEAPVEAVAQAEEAKTEEVQAEPATETAPEQPEASEAAEPETPKEA